LVGGFANSIRIAARARLLDERRVAILLLLLPLPERMDNDGTAAAAITQGRRLATVLLLPPAAITPERRVTTALLLLPKSKG